eukprot:1898212-Pleurochrysis_carterae.AAC.1
MARRRSEHASVRCHSQGPVCMCLCVCECACVRENECAWVCICLTRACVLAGRFAWAIRAKPGRASLALPRDPPLHRDVRAASRAEVWCGTVR